MQMTVDTYKALPWRQQDAFLAPHVLAFLRTLAAPVPTKRVMLAVADRIGWLGPDLEFIPDAGPMIFRALRRFQVHREGWAIHNGEEFEFVGKTHRRWMWQPQPEDMFG